MEASHFADASKFRKIDSAGGKIMASVFWDSEGVLMIGYLERGKTVTGVYCAELIRKLRSAIKEKRCGKSSHGVLLHQDDAPANTSAVAMAAIRECGFEFAQSTALFTRPGSV